MPAGNYASLSQRSRLQSEALSLRGSERHGAIYDSGLPTSPNRLPEGAHTLLSKDSLSSSVEELWSLNFEGSQLSKV